MAVGINKGYFDSGFFEVDYFTPPYFEISDILSLPYADRLNFVLSLNRVSANVLTLNSTSEKDLILNTQINFEIER
jgi:hypothetical protein